MTQRVTVQSAPETDVATTVDAQAKGVQIVDVREPDEWAEGHMAGAVLIPLGSVEARLQELDPSQPAITVCRSGKRSLYAAAMMLNAGFVDVKSMAGGMLAWVEAGHPVEQ